MGQIELFEGKRVLITGASSGIGLAIAHHIAECGADLILLSRSEGEINQLEQERIAGKLRGQLIWKKCDITNEAEVAATVQSLVADRLVVDILINNAGIALGAPKTFWEQPLSNIQKVIATNVFGMVNVTHALLNAFLIPANKGTILNISSVTGLEVPTKGMGEVSYHASKAFLEGFTNALRNEVIGTDIRILTLRPGFVRTKFHFDRVGQDQNKFDDVFQGLEELTPDDIAEAAVWMLTQPERISIKGLDVVPTAQRSLTQVDRAWNQRHHR
jgi:3-hydroxy acid dehydrogenase/malonic semialdehyde reductase